MNGDDDQKISTRFTDLRNCHHCDVIINALYAKLTAQDFDAMVSMVTHALGHGHKRENSND